MIETFARDFAEDIALELYMLSQTTPVNVHKGSTMSVIFSLVPGPKQFNVRITETMGLTVQGAVAQIGLRPLLFGSAWKILDMLAEHILYSVSGPPPRLTINNKIKAATENQLHCSPLSMHADIEKCVWAAYANAEQYRHSLVHRRAVLDPNGDFTGTDKSGATLRPLTAVEQDAFARMAQRVASCVTDGSLDTRELKRLAADLDTLNSLTLNPPLGYERPNVMSIREVKIEVTSTRIVNMADVKLLVYEAFSEKEIDIIFDVIDLHPLSYRCKLEDAPLTSLTIDGNTNTPWLERL